MRHVLMGVLMGVVMGVTMGAALLACGGSTPSATTATTATTAAPGSTASAPPSAPGAAGSAAAAPAPVSARVTAVRVAHGLMTFVMDSPAGQREKARVAVEGSALVTQLTGLGVAVTVVFDPAVGDDVVVTTPAGAELGRVPLDELEHKGAGADIVDAVAARR